MMMKKMIRMKKIDYMRRRRQCNGDDDEDNAILYHRTLVQSFIFFSTFDLHCSDLYGPSGSHLMMVVNGPNASYSTLSEF